MYLLRENLYFAILIFSVTKKTLQNLSIYQFFEFYVRNITEMTRALISTCVAHCIGHVDEDFIVEDVSMSGARDSVEHDSHVEMVDAVPEGVPAKPDFTETDTALSSTSRLEKDWLNPGVLNASNAVRIDASSRGCYGSKLWSWQLYGRDDSGATWTDRRGPVTAACSERGPQL